MPEPLQIALAVLVLTAAFIDVRTRKIPNWLTFPCLLIAIVLQTILRGWSGLADAAVGALLAFVIYSCLFALRGMAAGDVKLMTAAAACTGKTNWIVLFLITAMFSAVFALITTLLRGTLWRTMKNIGLILAHLARLAPPYRTDASLDVAHPDAVTLPHGLSVALGCLLFLVLLNLQP